MPAPDTLTPADRTATARLGAKPQLSGLGRLYAVVAWIEAFTWAGLIVGMVLKYVTETTEAGVWLFGRLHGGAFVAYVVVALIVALKHRWGLWRTFVALAAAVPPLTTVVVEWWLRRTGHLSEPAQIPGSPERRP